MRGAGNKIKGKKGRGAREGEPKVAGECEEMDRDRSWANDGQGPVAKARPRQAPDGVAVQSMDGADVVPYHVNEAMASWRPGPGLGRGSRTGTGRDGTGREKGGRNEGEKRTSAAGGPELGCS